MLPISFADLGLLYYIIFPRRSYLIGVSDRGFSVPLFGSQITGVFPDSLHREFPLNSNFNGSVSLFFSITTLVEVKPTKEFLIMRIVGTKTTSGSLTKPTTKTFMVRL